MAETSNTSAELIPRNEEIIPQDVFDSIYTQLVTNGHLELYYNRRGRTGQEKESKSGGALVVGILNRSKHEISQAGLHDLMNLQSFRRELAKTLNDHLRSINLSSLGQGGAKFQAEHDFKILANYTDENYALLAQFSEEKTQIIRDRFLSVVLENAIKRSIIETMLRIQVGETINGEKTTRIE